MFEILCRTDLSERAKLVYALLKYAPQKLTSEDISAHLNLPVSSIKRALGELTSKCLVSATGWPKAFKANNQSLISTEKHQDKKPKDFSKIKQKLSKNVTPNPKFGESTAPNKDQKTDPPKTKIENNDPLFKELLEAIEKDKNEDQPAQALSKIQRAIEKSKRDQEKLDQGFDPRSTTNSLLSYAGVGVIDRTQYVLPNTIIPVGNNGMVEHVYSGICNRYICTNSYNNLLDLNLMNLMVYSVGINLKIYSLFAIPGVRSTAGASLRDLDFDLKTRDCDQSSQTEKYLTNHMVSVNFDHDFGACERRKIAQEELQRFWEKPLKTLIKICDHCGGSGSVGIDKFVNPPGPDCPVCSGRGSIKISDPDQNFDREVLRTLAHDPPRVEIIRRDAVLEFRDRTLAAIKNPILPESNLGKSAKPWSRTIQRRVNW